MADTDTDHFALFGLPRAPTLDVDELTKRYRALAREVHPDRYAGAAQMQRQLAMQQTSRLNDAYAILKKPLPRAAYLLSLYGADVFAEQDTAMPADFLEQQIEWREAMMEADDDAARQTLRQEITAARDEIAAAAEGALTALVASNGGDTQPAYDLLRKWTYMEKLLAPTAMAM